jgi:hypothetical protein
LPRTPSRLIGPPSSVGRRSVDPRPSVVGSDRKRQFPTLCAKKEFFPSPGFVSLRSSHVPPIHLRLGGNGGRGSVAADGWRQRDDGAIGGCGRPTTVPLRGSRRRVTLSERPRSESVRVIAA